MDIRLFYSPSPAMIGQADLRVENADLAKGHDLETAVIVSLFTDRRARKDDRLPDSGGSRRGWWGDSYSEIPGDQIGSRLWLLHREKQTEETLNRAREYVDEALRWMVEDGVASRVETEVEYIRRHWMAIKVVLYRPTGAEVFRFDYLWEQSQFAIINEDSLVFNEPSEYVLAEDGTILAAEDDERLILE